VLNPFGQEQFEASEATSGDLADPEYVEARNAATGTARSALDGALSAGNLDAIITLTGHPAWLIDPVLGDAHRWGTSGPAAVSGYPSITVPAGAVSGLPVGLSFTGPAWSEPRLIALAHAFEIAGRWQGNPRRAASVGGMWHSSTPRRPSRRTRTSGLMPAPGEAAGCWGCW
jgi:hypothetical protein